MNSSVNSLIRIFCILTLVLQGVLQVGPSLVDGCPSNSTQMTDGQLLCFACTQATTVDTVIAYITHDDRPKYNIGVKPVRSEATWLLVHWKIQNWS